MDRPVSEKDNFYFEMESVKQEAEVGVYNDVVCAISKKPKSSEKFPQGQEARQTGDSIQAMNAFHSHRLEFVAFSVFRSLLLLLPS